MEALHERLGTLHRWVVRRVYGVTPRQAGELKRGLEPQLGRGRRVEQEIYCYDCGMKYIGSASNFRECVPLIR